MLPFERHRISVPRFSRTSFKRHTLRLEYIRPYRVEQLHQTKLPTIREQGYHFLGQACPRFIKASKKESKLHKGGSHLHTIYISYPYNIFISGSLRPYEELSDHTSALFPEKGAPKRGRSQRPLPEEMHSRYPFICPQLCVLFDIIAYCYPLL